MASIKIYVAAAFQDRDRARALAAILADQGNEITSTWFDDSADAVCDPTDASMRKHLALRCERQVRECDLLIALTPCTEDSRRKPLMGCGLWVEYGLARALWKRTIMVGSQRTRTVFCDLATAHSLYDTTVPGLVAQIASAHPQISGGEPMGDA